jgi:hypothetical protein
LNFDFTGVALFQEYLADRANAAQVLAHPAYQRVQLHARLFGRGITPQDLDEARLERESAFYGLNGLPARGEAIQRLLETLHREQAAWLNTAEAALAALFPSEPLDIVVYPILGYDMGIGLDGAACLNCNFSGYLEQPQEFLFYLIHECVHVLYERSHRLPGLQAIVSPADWRSYFSLWLQNEGYAVYTPWALRRERNGLAEGDYQVLADPSRREAHRQALLSAWQALQGDTQLPLEQYLAICFGPQRLTYRMGCELIRRIERAYGMQAARQAFYLSGDTFVRDYGGLLQKREDY